ncbi:MAG TPA: uracil-DNA glycosylase [Spirochaetota bacterium]|nr:uracil-DNA glycosylase [Spirochaetota bacterium]HQO22438.1 uracil-DNA glycosylase [Spirochaetota bacterium]HQQ24224.1 uracil-DNA glycosylase [Spirochaetota bacterium]
MTKTDELILLSKEVEKCTLCRLHSTRSKTVFGEGSAEAKIIFIGEGPGKNEDIQGIPFCGKAGALLTSIIEKGIRIPRSSVYICNLVKCRPTVDLKMIKDRPPADDELAECSKYLKKQIEIIKPEVIVTLGSPATKYILNTKDGITSLRGKWGEYMGIPVMPTFHPSYVIRNGGEKSPLKKDVWNDIKLVMERVGIPIEAKE